METERLMKEHDKDEVTKGEGLLEESEMERNKTWRLRGMVNNLFCGDIERMIWDSDGGEEENIISVERREAAEEREILLKEIY